MEMNESTSSLVRVLLGMPSISIEINSIYSNLKRIGLKIYI